MGPRRRVPLGPTEARHERYLLIQLYICMLNYSAYDGQVPSFCQPTT